MSVHTHDEVNGHIRGRMSHTHMLTILSRNIVLN